MGLGCEYEAVRRGILLSSVEMWNEREAVYHIYEFSRLRRSSHQRLFPVQFGMQAEVKRFKEAQAPWQDVLFVFFVI